MDYSKDVAAVHEFASSITTIRCSGCGQYHNINEDDVLLFVAAFLNGTEESIEFHLSCNVCDTTTCVGCNSQISPLSEKFGKTSQGTQFVWHCEGARLALIWLVLCGYDSQAKQNERAMVVKKPPLNKNKHKQGPSGIGYSLSHDPIGADDLDEDEESDYEEFTGEQRQYKPSTTPTKQDLNDPLTVRIIGALVALLPSTTEQLIPTLFDANPPDELTSLLKCSSILERAAGLLRSSSLTDATRRFDVYSNLFSFIRALSHGGGKTSAILRQPRANIAGGHNLLSISYNASIDTGKGTIDLAAPLASCMADLTKQSQMMLKRAAKDQVEFETEESQQMLLLCTNINDSAELFWMGGKAVSTCTNSDDTTENKDPYSWQEEMRVLEVSDEDILKQHSYADQAVKIKSPPIGRMRNIINELATLRTGLPPNIFVRYGEYRLDVMKILIVGPKGTPYENGLFEFDLLCPAEYPNKPPSMLFKTTGGGRIGFNPNLYSNGKVCLSLLGTWSGEPWQPGKSTLLQVFVSIQAMIFCAEPWCNEPGREREAGTEQSKLYNRGLYRGVVEYGMLDWMRGRKSTGSSLVELEEKDVYSGTRAGMWKEVAEMHFGRTGGKIRETLKGWAEERRSNPIPSVPAKKQKLDPQYESSAAAKTVEMGLEMSLGEFLAEALENF